MVNWFLRRTVKKIPENAPVRLASAMLEELDSEKLYGAYSPLRRKSAADPRVLFKVLVLGYIFGIYSSRKLEDACRYRIDFMWLLEDGKAPDHTTQARFHTGRRSGIIEDLFYQFVRKLGEVDQQTVFIDGTKLENRARRYTFVCFSNPARNLYSESIFATSSELFFCWTVYNSYISPSSLEGL